MTCDAKGEVLTGGSDRLWMAASEEETSTSHTSKAAAEVAQLQEKKTEKHGGF